MVAVGRHTDKHGNRRPAIIVCGWLAALALAASPYFHAPAPALAALTVAAAGIWSILAPFWTLPHALLRDGAAKASGLALINAVGNLGGFAGPYLVAWLKTATGDYKTAFPLLAAILAAGVMLIKTPDSEGR